MTKSNTDKTLVIMPTKVVAVSELHSKEMI